nr:PREDICTED: uncharacterized protein LOC109034737 [Bemisia tabaci]
MDIFKYVQCVILWSLNVVAIGTAAPLPGEGISLIDFLMASSAKNVQRISFGPDDGLRYRKSYEEKYGPRGRDLVAMLGQGDVNVGSGGYFSFGKNREKAKVKRNNQTQRSQKAISSTTTTTTENPTDVSKETT